MKTALIYAKAGVSLAAFAAYAIFALLLNEKLKPLISGVERGMLVGLSVVGAGFLIAKANEYVSSRFFDST